MKAQRFAALMLAFGLTFSLSALPAGAEEQAASSDDQSVTAAIDAPAVSDADALPAPTVTSAVNNTSCITVRWTPVAGAEGYLISRSDNGGEPVCVGEADGSAASFADAEDLTNGARYSYTVTAWRYADDGTERQPGKGSAAKTIYRLNRPTISHINCVSSGIRLEWYPNTGATGVRIYRRTYQTDYELLATVSDGSTTYLDTTATENGRLYQYKLVYYKQTSDRSFSSAGVTATKFYLTPVTLSLGVKANGVQLTWSENELTSGYKLYRSTDGKSFTLIRTFGNSRDTGWTDTTAQKGHTYYYKLVGYMKYINVIYNGVFSGTKKILR